MLLYAFHPRALADVVPVAAADYFLASPLLRVFAQKVIGILPLERTVSRRTGDPLAGAFDALAKRKILVVFPEGTRGRPEEMGALKGGLSKLAVAAGVEVVPVYLQGAGRILPKGSRVPVPFTCTALVGAPIGGSDRAAIMRALGEAFAALKAQAPPLLWH